MSGASAHSWRLARLKCAAPIIDNVQWPRSQQQLRFASESIIDVCHFPYRPDDTEHNRALRGEYDLLACHGCDFHFIGSARSFSPWQTRCATSPRLPCRVFSVGRSKRFVGFPTGELVHWICSRSHDCYMHRSACHAGGSLAAPTVGMMRGLFYGSPSLRF